MAEEQFVRRWLPRPCMQRGEGDATVEYLCTEVGDKEMLTALYCRQ